MLKPYLLKGMWEHLQFILFRAHPRGDGHQYRGGLRTQGCTSAGAGATRWKDTSCQAPSSLGSLIIPLLSPFTLRMCRLLPAGISLRSICGIIPATPCLERYLELTEMLINDSAGRWDSRSPSAVLPRLCLSCGLSSRPTSNTLRLSACHSSRLYCRDEFREQQAGPDQTLTVGRTWFVFPEPGGKTGGGKT